MLFYSFRFPRYDFFLALAHFACCTPSAPENSTEQIPELSKCSYAQLPHEFHSHTERRPGIFGWRVKWRNWMDLFFISSATTYSTGAACKPNNFYGFSLLLSGIFGGRRVANVRDDRMEKGCGSHPLTICAILSCLVPSYTASHDLSIGPPR